MSKQVLQPTSAANTLNRTLLVALAAAGFAATASAQATQPVTLETVVVTASAREQAIKDAPASITVITREQLDKLPAANLADAINRIEGVSYVGGSANEGEINIRGMSGEYTLILVDGKRQGTRETMNRGTSGVQQYLIPPMDAIERIEIVRGPMSALYGSDAMGGVINIITRKVPSKWSGTVTLGGIWQEDSKLGDSQLGDFWVSGPLFGDTVGLQLFGNHTDRDEDKYYYATSATNGAFGTRNNNLGAKLTIKPSKDQDISVEAGKNELRYTRTPGESIAANAAPTKTLHERTYVALNHDGRWGFGTSNLSLQQEVGEQKNWTSGALTGATPKVTNTVLNGQLNLPFSSHMLKLGGQYSNAKVEGISKQDSIAGYPSNIDSVTVKSWALFAEDDYFVTDKFTVTGGVRLDHDERYGSHWTPRLYGVYHLSPKLTLRGGVAGGFRAPTVRQTTEGYCMTSGGPVANFQPPGTLCGNPNLKPETSTTQEIGLSYELGRGSSVSATLFNNDFKNKVVSYDTGVVDPLVPSRHIYVYDQISKVRLRGIELSGKYQLSPQLKASVNYTLTESKRKAGGEPAFDGSSLEGRPLDKTPKHTANAQLDWTPFNSLSAYVRTSYVGKQYWAAFRNGAAGVRTRPGATTFDLGGTYVINKMFSVKFAALNVTDKVVAIDDRARLNGLDGNWMVDEGRRYWLSLSASF